jgi:hypothetical protein
LFRELLSFLNRKLILLDMVEKVVHVLVNTFVVVPFMPWDVASEKVLLDETAGNLDLPKTDECACLKRSASFDEVYIFTNQKASLFYA